MNKNNTARIKKEDGSAIIETLPLLIIFMTILGNMWGFFMAVHSGILSSIGARTYAFETFRNRADLTYFRDQEINSGDPYTKQKVNYYLSGLRTHAVTKPNNQNKFYPLAINYNKFSPAPSKASSSIQVQHSHDSIFSEHRATNTGVKEIWIRSNYGMCLNFAGCKKNNI